MWYLFLSPLLRFNISANQFGLLVLPSLEPGAVPSAVRRFLVYYTFFLYPFFPLALVYPVPYALVLCGRS